IDDPIRASDGGEGGGGGRGRVNVSCPECRSVFRVDPEKVPRVGVRARCSVCGGVIIVGGAGSIDEEFGSPIPATPPATATLELAEAALVGATSGISDAILAVELPPVDATPNPRQPTPVRPTTAIPRAATQTHGEAPAPAHGASPTLPRRRVHPPRVPKDRAGRARSCSAARAASASRGLLAA